MRNRPGSCLPKSVQGVEVLFNILILGLVSFLTDVSSEMVYPLVPLYLTTRLGAGPAVVGIIEGIAESLASLVKVFSGYFSDRLRLRKPFAILGYAGSTVGKVFLYLSDLRLYAQRPRCPTWGEQVEISRYLGHPR